MIDPEIIRNKSIELGFSACGFAKAESLPIEKPLSKWLENSRHGQMKFMENYQDLRADPNLLFPGSKTIISLLASYYNEEYEPSGSLKVSRYAVGRDYHKVLKKRGKHLIEWIKEFHPDIKARIFVDSAPIMEKEWARRSGLGWIGKNTCLIRPGEGSWFFIAEIITDLEIIPDTPEDRDLCGHCTRCIDACPTDALSIGGGIDARKCISYQTIELKDDIPPEYFGKTDRYLFGCDICQEACPHNKFAKRTMIPDFDSREIFRTIDPDTIATMNLDEFEKLFAGTPIMRAGLDKLKRTCAFLYPGD